MARKKPMQYVPMEERPEFIAALEALPVEPVELEVRASRVLELYHDAMLAADVQALDDAHLVYRACVLKLNGGTAFGSASVQDALAAKFAARAGQVPKWGQAGEFLLDVEGMRIVVRMDVGSLANHCGAELCAVDFDKPFVSRTGYRHQFMAPAHHVGRTVDQAVRAEVLALLAGEGKAVAIDKEHGMAKDRKVYPWLADALAGVRADGQLAMFGDAPKDPAAKVPMSNADRQKAFRQRQRELKAEGAKSVLLSRDELSILWWAVDVFVTVRKDMKMLESTYYTETLAKVFKGAPWWEPDGLSQLGNDSWVQVTQKQEKRELNRAWDAYKEERKRTDKLSDDLSQARAENRRLQSGLQEIAAEVGGVAVVPTAVDEVAELRRRVEALERENALLESERNKAHGAIQLWEQRLRNAGQSTDYRPQAGE